MTIESVLRQAREQQHLPSATIAWMIPASEMDAIIEEMEQQPGGKRLDEFMEERGFTPVWGNT